MDPFEPPPVLGDARVLQYAVVDETVTFTGALQLFVDGRRLGAVPRLALCEAFDGGELLLLHCDEAWEVLGIQVWEATVESVASVKERAGYYYTGISAKWLAATATLEEARMYREALTLRCSGCGRSMHDVHSLTAMQDGNYICDLCEVKAL